MALVAGRKANIYASTTSTAINNKIGSVNEWRMNIAENLINVTNHDSSGWNQTISGGIKTGSWTADSFEPSTAAAQVDIRSAILNGSTLFMSFLLTTSTASPKWTGWSRIDNIGYGAPTETGLVHDVSGEQTGAMTYTS